MKKYNRKIFDKIGEYTLLFWGVFTLMKCINGTIYSYYDYTFWALISGIFAPLIAFIAGLSIKRSLSNKNIDKRLVFILGILFVVLSSIWIYYTGWFLTTFYRIDGNILVILLFISGLIVDAKNWKLRDIF